MDFNSNPECRGENYAADAARQESKITRVHPSLGRHRKQDECNNGDYPARSSLE